MVPVMNIPVSPQLETMRSFIANSLMVELKVIHVAVTDPNTRHRDQRRLAVTAERIYDGYSTHTLSMREYVLIHIIYSLYLYNEGIRK